MSDRLALLFVNKTADSKSLSNSKADTDNVREINQHVQRSRDLIKERLKKRRLSRSRLPLGWITSNAASHPLSPALRSAWVTDDAVTDQDVADNEERSDISAADHSPAVQFFLENSPSTLSLLSPKVVAMEPFGQFKVSMNAEKHRILQYFVVKFFPTVTRLDIVAFIGDPKARLANPAIQVIRNSLSDELHILSLLTAASARMKYVEQYHFARHDLPERLADAAIRLLRRYLAEGRPVTQQLIQSILYLWALESYRRNWDGVAMHGNMTMYLCNTYFGGFRNLDPYLRRMLWVADRYQAAATARPPLVEERWETAELSTQQYTCVTTALRQLGKIPAGARFAQHSEVLSRPFQQVLQQVVNLACAIQCHWHAAPRQPLLPDRDWAVARSYTVSDELLSFKDQDVGTTDSWRHKLTDCLRLALIVWLAFIPASAPYSPVDGMLTIKAAIDARPLRARLSSVATQLEDLPASHEECALLFWVAGLGAVASELAENQEWFALQFQRVARKLGIFTWANFEPINQGYLSLEKLQPPNLTKLTWLLQRACFAKVSEAETRGEC
ncbi:hypothetical protein B0A52_05746 [Exophiala mesophila]|uniref:Transcription factor domain-containing protein n=1 Tax=Exophiala mesophila TaxID=212818 RepID=A0A438N2E7_EXOME|nr:hypothetical protein B0A52_05746 [Exophiala mesophila]